LYTRTQKYVTVSEHPLREPTPLRVEPLAVGLFAFNRQAGLAAPVAGSAAQAGEAIAALPAAMAAIVSNPSAYLRNPTIFPLDPEPTKNPPRGKVLNQRGVRQRSDAQTTRSWDFQGDSSKDGTGQSHPSSMCLASYLRPYERSETVRVDTVVSVSHDSSVDIFRQHDGQGFR